MSPVHIDELNPETRARVLKQIEETDGVTTTLAVAEPKTRPFYTPAEMRARSILSRMDSLSAKLKTLEDDIRALWLDFENLKVGETIVGCATKKEFCEKKLHRTPRAIQYMLTGGNPDNAKRHEIISLPPAPSPDAEPDESPVAHPATARKVSPPRRVPSACPKCEKSFESRSQLKKHGVRDHGISPEQSASFMKCLEPPPYQENAFDLTALFFGVGMDVHVKPVSPEQQGDVGNFHMVVRNLTAAEVRATAGLDALKNLWRIKHAAK